MDRFLRTLVYVVLTAATVWTLFGCRSVSEDVADRSVAPQTQVAERSPAWSGRTGI